MKFVVPVIIGILLAACSGPKPDHVITTVTLLGEMTDLQRLTRLPADNYRTVQFSSYDRRSTKATDSCWFSNEDGFGNEPIPAFQEVLKKPDSTGTGEYLICDVKQPGAIVRLWTAGLNGSVRLYLDNVDVPVYEGDAQDFFWKTVEVMSGRESKPEYTDLFRQFDASYFPIPFSRRCRMEWIGDIRKIHFYHVGLRIYGPDVRIETYSISGFGSYSKKIEEIKNVLSNPSSADSMNLPELHIPVAVLADSSKKEIFYKKGEGAIEYLSLRISAADLENALRKSLLTIYFDDASVPQVQAPLGDFFGSAPGLNPYQSLPFSVQSDSSMICRFVMPFRTSVRIEVENFSGSAVRLNGSLKISENKWEEGVTMHFRTRWKIDHGITASTFESGRNAVQDIVYLVASGQGRVVGTAALIYNPSQATTSWGNWWGEGDEKIFVDRDTFPSFYGTGSEDYFNYSWSSPRIFSNPYCGQPRNDGPGNRGYVSDFRWHILDDILFRDKIAFYMELGHHGVVPDFSYGRIVYYYALPGSVDDYRKISRADISTVPYFNWEPVAYLGSAGFRYIQSEDLFHETPSLKAEQGKLWAGGKLMMWRPAAKGDKIKFNINSISDSVNVILGMTLDHNPDGGTIAVSVNGMYVGFDGNELINLFEPVQTTLVNHFSDQVTLKKGKNEIVIESLDEEKHKKTGIDFIWIKEQ